MDITKISELVSNGMTITQALDHLSITKATYYNKITVKERLAITKIKKNNRKSII